VLTKADDFPIHQTSEPIAVSGTDRNFYDRYFFSALSPDGSLYVAGAFGVYPHLGVADAHVAVLVDGVEHCVHASRHLVGGERSDLTVGPITVTVEEPLRRLRLTCEETEGVAVDLVLEGRAFPIEEPRFIHRRGTRIFMDATRLTQNVRVTGSVAVEGTRRELPAGMVGTRDRSWGVRPVGSPDAQPIPGEEKPQFFWMWSPVNLSDRSVYFHVNDDALGRPWNTRSVLCPDGATGPEEMVDVAVPTMSLELAPGTRRVARAVLDVQPVDGPAVRATYTPIGTFAMRGIGYSHPRWSHGVHQGPLAVEHEVIDTTALDSGSPHDIHIQAICEVTVEEEGRQDEHAVALLEQLFVGPYAPLGLTGILDPAS
jgi:hypothetical protein